MTTVIWLTYGFSLNWNPKLHSSDFRWVRKFTFKITMWQLTWLLFASFLIRQKKNVNVNWMDHHPSLSSSQWNELTNIFCIFHTWFCSISKPFGLRVLQKSITLTVPFINCNPLKNQFTCCLFNLEPIYSLSLPFVLF